MNGPDSKFTDLCACQHHMDTHKHCTALSWLARVFLEVLVISTSSKMMWCCTSGIFLSRTTSFASNIFVSNHARGVKQGDCKDGLHANCEGVQHSHPTLFAPAVKAKDNNVVDSQDCLK